MKKTIVALVSTILMMACGDDSSNNTNEGDVSINSESGCSPCEYGKLTDERDGQSYRTVTIGSQTWMAENLNYEIDYSWCGGASGTTEGNCETYGRLYTWATAVGKSEDECGYGHDCTTLGSGNVQGVCPDGWHVPTKEEWNALFAAVGGQSTAGQKLKAMTGWKTFDPFTNNEDAYGFSALPVDRNGGVGNYAFFWSATESSSSYAYHMVLGYHYENAYLPDDTKNSRLSVRCLKD